MSIARSYVLLTTAKNEAAHIELTLTSIVAQTVLPLQWVMIDDGSTDKTAEYMQNYAGRYPFIKVLRRPPGSHRDFGSKVFALREAWDALDKSLPFSYVGFLDGDISFEPDFYGSLIGEMEKDPHTGLVGGLIREKKNDEWFVAHRNPEWCVGGGSHFFRRDCFEQTGFYPALRHGGEDTIIEYIARDWGWNVRVVMNATVYHHKPTVIPQGGYLTVAYHMGVQEYMWGASLSFEILKSLKRIPDAPFLAGSIVRLWAYLRLVLKKAPRDVDAQTVAIVRKQQRGRLRHDMLHLFGIKSALP